MSEKNRFGKLLKHLMAAAELKYYTLAQELQYDVSYISKWTGGQMLPAEKYAPKILEGISNCIVLRCSSEAAERLMEDYQVNTLDDLKQAILDNLEAEYNYVRQHQNGGGNEAASGVEFWPELKMAQFVSQMQHPVLRRVNGLDIVGVFDILSVGREYQRRLTDSQNKHVSKGMWYQNVHYHMVISVEEKNMDCPHDIIFLVDLLNRNQCIDFYLYGNDTATGKAVLVVGDDYMISGMLADREQCVSVVTSELSEYCRSMYRSMKALCRREDLLFRKTSMKEMLLKHEYVHGLFALRQQWVIGHLTEHFLPEDLFEEIAEQIKADSGTEKVVSMAELRSIHRIIRNALEKFRIRLLFYRTTFYNLAVDNELAFFNYKVHLTQKQVIRCLEYFIELCRDHPYLEIKMVPGKLIPNMEYSSSPCIFLCDTISHIRLVGDYNNMYIVNRNDMKKAFTKFFDEFWEDREGALITERDKIIASVRYIISGIGGNN